MDQAIGEESILGDGNVDCPTRNMPLMPTAKIFLTEDHDFQIVKITSSDECYNDDEEDNGDTNDTINISDVDDDGASTEEVNDDDQLELNTWPVTVKLEMDVGNIDFSYNNFDGGSSDVDNSCKDTDENCGNNDDTNKTPNGGKRKKLSKMRKKAVFYTCKRCGVKFSSLLELNMHTHTTHNINYSLYFSDNKFTCLTCRKTFALKSSLDEHITNVHTEKKVISCTKCNKVFNYRSYLTRNAIIKNSNGIAAHNSEVNKQFTCFHCNLKR